MIPACPKSTAEPEPFVPTGLGDTLHVPTVDEEPDLGETYRKIILDDITIHSYPITGAD
jgi:hypothetical protein